MSTSLTDALSRLNPLGFTIGEDGNLAALTPEAKAAFEEFAKTNQSSATKPYESLTPQILDRAKGAVDLNLGANRGFNENSLDYESGRQPFLDNRTRRSIEEYQGKALAQKQIIDSLTDRPYSMQEALIADQPVARQDYIKYRKDADKQNMIAKLLLGAGLMFS